MRLTYRNNKLGRVCTNAAAARKAYGDQQAERLHMRIDQISAAINVETLVQGKVGRCHPLVGDYKGYYAMDLIHPYRLLFTVKQSSIQVACIEDILDYH